MSPTDQGRGARDGQAGTTLVEALVVMTITTMTVLIGLPAMRQGIAILAQRETVAVVAALLRDARAQAMRADGPVMLGVSTDGRAYGIVGQRPAPAPAGVSVSMAGQGAGPITFYGDGSSSGGVVQVRAQRRILSVRVTPVSGVVTVAR